MGAEFVATVVYGDRSRFATVDVHKKSQLFVPAGFFNDNLNIISNRRGKVKRKILIGMA